VNWKCCFNVIDAVTKSTVKFDILLATDAVTKSTVKFDIHLATDAVAKSSVKFDVLLAGYTEIQIQIFHSTLPIRAFR
jgi:hypothetical protein